MKSTLFITIGLLLFVSCAGDDRKAMDWPEIKTEHKPFTRWWWMGNAVDRENLTYNLEEFAKAGIGGVEIASIYGVRGEEEREIAYLSDEWMAMYTHTVNEANRLGMYVDLTNGSGWPFGGPHISVEDAATKFRIVTKIFTQAGMVEFPVDELLGSNAPEYITLNKLIAYRSDGEIVDVTDKVGEDGILRWDASGNTWQLYGVFNDKTRRKVERSSPGGEGWVADHFSKKAIGDYFKAFDEAFARSGAPMPRMFFNDSYEVHRADWTPEFFPEFEKRRGYKLENYLPTFTANDTTELSRRVISDYRLTIDELLKDNFVSPWLDWVHTKGSKVRNQSHGSPGNLIDIYAMVDVPECETFGRTAFDIPGLQVDSGMRLNDSNPAVLKFASSAAHITGKTLTSAETFTWLTEHFRTALSQCKPEIDQMFASGVNHVFFHGSPYSPKEAEWPGWRFYASVNMSPTNNIWRDVPAFFEYITRCQSFLQEGAPDNDFLLYFPIYDFWNDYRNTQLMPFSIHNMVRMIPEFNRTVADIMALGYDLDYISDTFITSLRLENGELVTSGGTHYQALIIPNNRYMPQETLENILALVEQGATVVFADRYPADVPGLKDLEQRREKMQTLTARLPESNFGETANVYEFGMGRLIMGSDYETLLGATEVEPEPFKTQFGGQYNRRAHKDGHIYFLTMLHNETIDGWVHLAKPAKSVMIFDPMTGEKGLAQVDHKFGTAVYLQLEPGQSVILKTFTEKTVDAQPWEYLRKETHSLILNEGWSLSFVESAPAIEGIFNIGKPVSWTELPHENAQINMGTASYQTTFTLPEIDSANEWILDLGQQLHESAKVRINGQDAGTIFAIPYSARVGKHLHPGENTIEIEVTNLPANRIRDFDKRGVEWRIFEDINIVNVFYSPMQYDVWDVTPSGLTGPVTLTPMKNIFQ